MKIYTRTGDDGTTGLFGGGRVKKYHARIHACGLVDETNAAIGVALALLPDPGSLEALVSSIQHDLFDLGSDLATPQSARVAVPRIGPRHVKRLEDAIDAHEADLEPLKNFILPGGVPAAAMLHLARTVCRRAERHLVGALEELDTGTLALQYLNRLSDLLFVLTRWVNRKEGINDIPWIPQVNHKGNVGS